jgi:hypothetical protein
MKNLLSAAGALSLGAASLAVITNVNAAEGGAKPWSASAALRGFYDDNILTAPKGSNRVIDSWGFELSPSLGYTRTMDNSSFSLGYTYLARWFEDRPGSQWDQNHTVNAKFSHEFSPRLKLNLSDDFVSAQDPEQLAPLSGQVLRAEGDNINNTAAAGLSIGVSERVSAIVGYRNGYYDYDLAAYADALNRMEHLPSVDVRYLLNPSTSLIVGYQFGIFDFDAVTAGRPNRDYNSHYIYGGVDHQFLQNFSGSVTAGAQVTEYDLGGTDTTPYINGNLVYAYAPGSTATVGLRHTLNATDVLLDALGNLAAANQESTAFYVRWTHAFSGKLKGSALAQFQSSDFNGGSAEGQTENFWTLGASASYALTPHVALEAAYYYDHLDSDLDNGLLGQGRGYGRNRLFMGVRASF